MAHIPGHMTKDITPEEFKYGVGDAYSPPQQATPGILGIGNMLPPLFNNTFPLPNHDTVVRPGFPSDGFKQLPIHTPLPSPLPDNGLHPIKEIPDFQDQFNSFNKTLGGFGDQVTGFGDQMTGIEKGIMDRLAKIEEGIAGLMPQGAGVGAQATVPYGNSTNQGGISSVYTGTNSRGY